MIESEFDINEPLSFKGNFVDKEESAITAKPIRNDQNITFRRKPPSNFK